MNTRESIVRLLEDRGALTSADLCAALGVSRQAVNQQMQKLVRDGRAVKVGHTKGAYYDLPNRAPREPAQPATLMVRLDGAEEDRVYRRMQDRVGLWQRLPENVEQITAYAFQEMMNNAIDHSGSPRAEVQARITNLDVTFTIRDWGVGLFASVARRFDRQREEEALGDLIKGKVTTQPDRHSGEGIFFTSRIADLFRIDSHRLLLEFDQRGKDVFSGQRRFLKGTQVTFTIARTSRKRLEDLFAQFAPERLNYRFDKTRVAVKLIQDAYVSRSEARRLLAGLDQFREVELDFSGVASIGQSFADEVFRVFPRHHNVIVKPHRASPGVQAMIDHVRRDHPEAR